MISKIQKHLLLHHPTIWNVRLIPAILILAVAHILFFAIGYASIDTNPDSNYYSRVQNDLEVLYFVSILAGILILIGWLAFYNRNNGFKTFYPRRSSRLYFEWIFILFITTGITLLPFTLTKGGITKWRAEASFEETVKALDILEQAKILIPSDEYYYQYNREKDKPIPIPHNFIIPTYKLNSNYITSYDKNNKIVIEGYVGPSLLFYDSNSYEYNNKTDKIKHWLIKGNTDSIYNLLHNVEQLHTKNNILMGISPTEWMNRIYNPPFFAVDCSRMISCDKTYDSENIGYAEAVEVASDTIAYISDAEATNNYDYNKLPYVEFNKLENKYQRILDCYESYEDMSNLLLVCLSISLWASMFVYSFRISGGKSWIIAFIASGVLIFLSILLAVGLSSIGSFSDRIFGIFISLFWLSLFIVLFINTLIRISSNGYKGYSKIFINIVLWLLPCIIPFITMFLYQAYRMSDIYYHNYQNFIEIMFWINIPFTIISMWFIVKLVRKWKSIPEE